MKLISIYDCVLVFIFILFIEGSRSNFLTKSSPRDEGVVCSLVDCGQGTCVPSGTLYECECYPNWKQLFGSLSSCIIPNCTFNFNCDGAPTQAPPSPSIAAPPPPSFSLTDPCNLPFLCGDGACVPNGTLYACQCNPNAYNLMNLTNMPCIKSCTLGPDCVEVLGPSLAHAFHQPSLDPSNTPPGSIKDKNFAETRRVEILLPLVAFILAMLEFNFI